MQENRTIAKAASLIGGATLLSHLAGLVREQVSAAFFGTNFITDAFYAAWRIPNLLRSLVAEGAFTAAFVPVFSESLTKQGTAEAAAVFRSVFTFMLLALTALTAAGIIFAPQIVGLMTPGFKQNPEQFRLAVFFTRVLFPYIFLMGLTAICTGALNSLGRFAAPALGPFVVNLCVIAAALALAGNFDPPILALAVGILVGGVLQLAMQLPYLKKAGAFLGLRFKFNDPALKKILLLMGPGAIGAAVYQLSVFANTLMASYLPDGSISWLQFADRLMQFPLGVFSVAVVTAALPSLARQAAQNDQEGLMETMRFSLGLLFFITLPATAGLIALAEPLVAFLFEHGKFTHESTLATAAALKAYALGLPALSGSALLVRLFYSRKNTKTPAIVAICSLSIGVALAFVLREHFKHVGLALGSAAAYSINFIWLGCLLAKKERGFPHRPVLKEALSYLIWALIMAAAVYPLGRSPIFTSNFWGLTAKVGLSISLGVAIYMILAKLFNAPHLDSFLKTIKRKFGRKPA